MEGREDSAESAKRFRNADRIHGHIEATDRWIVLQAGGERTAGKFVCEHDLEQRVLRERGAPPRTQPGTSAAGAKVDDTSSTALTNGAENICLNGTVDVCPADDRFKTIGGSMADRRGAPRLI